jgi:peptidyl-prolyl cis-trans isomerase C
MEGMRALKTIIIKPLLLLLLIAFLLTACTEAIETPPPVVETPSPDVPTLTPLPEQPTATPLPAAVVINGERIPLDWFEREVERFLLAQEAVANEEVDEAAARLIVLNDLIDQVLLAQGAGEAGVQITEADVQAQIDSLAEDVDLDAWMDEWGYTREDLFQSLRLQMMAAYQRDLIAGSVPESAEQVELRQVFAFTEAGASRALTNLNAGTPFEDVAFEFSPDTGGYLGWVPRGYLLIPAIEEAVFDQPVGTYTDIIESDIGFHIVLVLDREVRPLSTDAKLTLTRQALYAWLEQRRAESIIEVLVD